MSLAKEKDLAELPSLKNSHKSFYIYSITRTYFENFSESGFLLVGHPHKWLVSQSQFFYLLYQKVAPIMRYIINGCPVSEDLPVYLTEFMEEYVSQVKQFMFEKARILIEKEYDSPCAFNTSQLDEYCLQERYFIINRLEHEFLDAIFTDSHNTVDLYYFSHKVRLSLIDKITDLIKSTTHKLSKMSKTLEVADLIFSGVSLGLIMNEKDIILHLHRDITKDIGDIFDLEALSKQRLNINDLQLNKMIVDNQILDEIIKQKYSNGGSNSGIRVVERGDLYYVFIHKSLPRLRTGNPKLTEKSLASKARGLLDKVRDLKKRDSILQTKAIIKMFGNYEDDQLFQAFAPGVASVIHF